VPVLTHPLLCSPGTDALQLDRNHPKQCLVEKIPTRRIILDGFLFLMFSTLLFFVV